MSLGPIRSKVKVMTSLSWQIREYRESDIGLLELGKRWFPNAEKTNSITTSGDGNF